MNRKVYRLFSAVMVLVMAVTLSGIGLIQGAAPASAITALKWVEIPTPGTDDLQLFPGSDVGSIAVSPDGATLFAAVLDSSPDYPPGAGGPNGWRVFKSIDGGYTWRETGFYDDAHATDPSDIVDIVVSPLWENNQYVYVATQTRVWWSSDSGNNFGQMGSVIGVIPANPINCMDVGVDKDGLLRVVVGNGAIDGAYNADVYLLVYDTWVRQHVGVGLCTVLCASSGNYVDAVLDVAFAPTYGDEAMAGSGYGWIFALVRTEHFAPPSHVDQAILRCETQAVEITGDVGNWGAPVQDAYFYHNGAIECPGGSFSSQDCGILAVRGSMAFADDFADQQSVFVGMTAWDCPPGATVNPRGDVFRVDVGQGIIYPSAIADLNVRSANTQCNIWSLDVSGNADTAYILAGLHETSTTGAPSTWQSGAHFSDNGGATWMPSFKPPSGMLTAIPGDQWNEPNLVMAPDFGTSGIAYCGTYGAFSGFWVTVYEGTSWNGRGLLDMDTQSITSIAVSPNYASDENMFMVQKMTIELFGPLGILWETQDAGSHWEVILAMNSMFPLPGVNVDWVELPHGWPSDNSIFVTGRMSVQPAATQSMIIRSNDGGKTFTTFIQGPQDPGFIYRPPAFGSCWDTPDTDTMFIGDNNGGVWYTDNAGFGWNKCDSSVIPVGQAITDLVERDGALLIGTDEGTVYFCYDWQTDFSIQRVGEMVGAVGDWTSVAFDAEYELNDIVYCGLYDTGGTENGNVWRFDLGASVWEQISDTRITYVPANWVNPPVRFSDPPINGTFPMWVGSVDGAGNPIGGGALKCGKEGTLYTLDTNFNASNGVGNLSWRCTDPELATINLGTEPLWEPLGDGLGQPYNPIDQKGRLTGDLEVVTGSNILFAIGLDDDLVPTIWTYHDTLTADLGPLDLIRPANAAIGVGTLAADNTEACLTLQWEPATDATKYEWEIGTSPELTVDGGFVSLWAHAQFTGYQGGDVDTQRFTNGEAIAGCLPPGETYYWHVRVVQPFQSPWSEIWSFTTMPTSAAERPLLTSPASGEPNVIRRPAFTWTQAVGAEKYELRVWECANPGFPVIEKTGDDNAVTCTSFQAPQDLKYDTNYCWQVKAIGGNDPVSATGTFTTMAQPAVVEEEGTPFWVWVVIGVSALMLVAVIVLIVLTKKV